jgi:CRISPR-associated protein Cas1
MKKRFYLYKCGNLIRQDNSLVLVTPKEKIYIPVEQIDIIYIFGHCTFNKNTIALLNKYDIMVQFFSYYGNYLGGYYPYYPIKGDTLLSHVSIIQIPMKKFEVAREIISSSIHNMHSILKYYKKKGRNIDDKINIFSKIEKEVSNLRNDNNSLLLLEARSKQIYYSTFNDIIKNPYFTFTTRQTRPPKDAINAILSYGYAILYGLIRSVIFRSKLQINLPFVHGTAKECEGLVYDISDIFKPVLVDRTIFRLINKKQISDNHFESSKGGIYLTKEGATIFINEFEKILQSTITVNKRKISYRSIVSLEVNNLANHICGKKKYYGFKMRW